MQPKLTRRVFRNIREAKVFLDLLFEDLPQPPEDYDDRNEMRDRIEKVMQNLKWARDRLVDDLKERPVKPEEPIDVAPQA